MNHNGEGLKCPPAESRWTEEQWKAIKSQGDNILVTAGAGAGKTMVLIKRLIEQICNDDPPVQLDRLLVVTFTNAAAAEMKKRLAVALEEEMRKNPHSSQLRRQLLLLHKAQISTIHSFCLEVIREHYYLLGIDPAMRLLDEGEAFVLQQDLLDELLEDYYANQELDSPFYRLVEGYSSARGDQPLQDLILKLYRFAWSHPEPEQWLIEKAAVFHSGEENSLRPWLEILREICRWELLQIIKLLELALEIAGQPGGPAPYRDNLEAELLMVEKALGAVHGSWDELGLAMQQISFDRLKPCRGDAFNPMLRKQVVDLRNRCKKVLTNLYKGLFSRNLEAHRKELACLAPLMQILVELVRDFHKRYFALKAEKGMADFNDLEHYALQILRDPQSPPGKYLPSVAALAYRERFISVLVDEYQDINQLQETIINLVSRESPGNNFMVGDVKQSIYRFRLAAPELFLKKQHLYDSDANSGMTIPLRHNFRSRKEVVDGVNYLFSQLMDEQLGEIAYDQKAWLRYAASYPAYPEDTDWKDPYALETLLLSADDPCFDLGQDISAEEDIVEPFNTDGDREEKEGETEEDAVAEAEEEWEMAALEGKLIARRIRELRGEGERKPLFIYDKEKAIYRLPAYRDIVILMRSYKNIAPVILEELQQCGIPAYAELSTGYFSAVEVEVMLSLLKIVDNPYQDIPLAAVLRSPLVGLKAEELAKIRNALPHGFYYEALLAFLTSDEVTGEAAVLKKKLSFFLEQLGSWQEIARQDSVGKLIWQIYADSGYYDLVGGMTGGRQRQANLRALYDRARQYEATSFRGLSRFLHFVERLREQGSDLGTARALGEQEDVVRLLTVHKSKGMEFPIVFVAGLTRRFNKQDLGGNFLVHRDLGFGPKYIDMNLRLVYPTLPWLAVRRKLEQELLAEEMRILYVALTRAEQKLILVAALKDLKARVRRWEEQIQQQDLLLPVFERVRASNYLDWIGPALLRHPQAHALTQFMQKEKQVGILTSETPAWRVEILGISSLLKQEQALKEVAAGKILVYDEKIKNLEPVAESTLWQGEIERRLAWQYPYAAATTHFAKLSVSALYKLQNAGLEGDDGDKLRMLELPYPNVNIVPRFIQDAEPDAARRGSVYHLVMQYLDLNQPLDLLSIKKQLAEMVTREQLTPQEHSLVEPGLIAAFFQGPLGKRLLKARQIWRELPFTMTLPAGEIYPEWQGEMEKVFIQGVIDCLFEEDDGLVLIDYKYGGGKSTNLDLLAEQYYWQLRYYALAAEEIYGKEVKEAYVYLINREETIRINCLGHAHKPFNPHINIE